MLIDVKTDKKRAIYGLQVTEETGLAASREE